MKDSQKSSDKASRNKITSVIVTKFLEDTGVDDKM